MIISKETYSEIVAIIQNHRGQCRELEKTLCAKYGIPSKTISSIISNECRRKMKKEHYKLSAYTPKLFKRYLAFKKESQVPCPMMTIADEMDVPYTFLAKAFLEKIYEQNETRNKSNVKEHVKDSTLIEDPDLAYEIYMCQLYDSQYGNISSVIGHALGQEYEYHLQKLVKEKKLTFQSEDSLRLFGYDKTPDIKLDIPFAVDGFIVNWIESKALFADEKEHQNYTKDQYLSYWNRFGTGLVIYWLGMVESIIDSSEKRFLVRDDFPKNITVIDPFSIANIPAGVSLDCQNSEK